MLLRPWPWVGALGFAGALSTHPAHAQYQTAPYQTAPPGAPSANAPPTNAPPNGAAPGLEAGGLAPPSALEPPPEPPKTQTEAELERADREDSGRGLEFVWLNADVGFHHVGLRTFSASDFAEGTADDAVQSGPAFGAGLGVRLIFLTLGARFRYSAFSQWQMWTLNGEVGMRIPIGNLEPYVFAGAGYAAAGGFATGSGSANLGDADVRGFNARLGGGLDYYLSDTFSIGANVSGDVMFLQRPSLGAGSAGTVYAADGTAIGAGVAVMAVIGLHF